MRFVTGKQGKMYLEVKCTPVSYAKGLEQLKEINKKWTMICNRVKQGNFYKKPVKGKKKGIPSLSLTEDRAKIVRRQLVHKYKKVYGMLNYLAKNDLINYAELPVTLNFNLLEDSKAIYDVKKYNIGYNPMSTKEFLSSKEQLLYKHTGSKERLEKQLASLQNRKARLTKMQNMSEDEKTNKHLDNATPEKLEEAQQFADKSIEIIENKLAAL